jgi:hypothetical protein
VCGEQISTSNGIPNPARWFAISDEVIEDDKFSKTLEASLEDMVAFYRCPVSGHLWFFWGKVANAPVGYAALAVEGVG